MDGTGMKAVSTEVVEGTTTDERHSARTASVSFGSHLAHPLVYRGKH
jgi:hypothetical protein